MFKFQSLVFALILTLAPQAFAAKHHLSLIHYGWIGAEENGVSGLFREFRLGYGDTEQQDQLANTPFRSSMGPFGMNAAVYLRNPDGTWNLFNFRLPNDSFSQKVSADQQQDFVAFMRRPDVAAVIELPYEKLDFGTPDDFIYRKMNLTAESLPEPFRRFPDEVLDSIAMVMQYNADQTAKAYFQQPYDREESAVALFQKIVDVIE